MAQSEAAAIETSGTDRSIDHDRFARACIEQLGVNENAPGMYDVVNAEGTLRTVDIEGASCQCGDHQYRGDRVYCKHAIAAAIHHVFVEGVTSRFVAEVITHAREHGCVHGHGFCDGVFGVGSFPCAECVSATNTGDWTVYQRLVKMGDS